MSYTFKPVKPMLRVRVFPGFFLPTRTRTHDYPHLQPARVCKPVVFPRRTPQCSYPSSLIQALTFQTGSFSENLVQRLEQPSRLFVQHS